jgi:hypothetical protein
MGRALAISSLAIELALVDTAILLLPSDVDENESLEDVDFAYPLARAAQLSGLAAQVGECTGKRDMLKPGHPRHR